MTDFANDLQSLCDAHLAITTAAKSHPSELPELFAYFHLDAEVFAQILMNHFPSDKMQLADRVFWLQVAEAIGPDHIHLIRHVGAFMDKASSF